jgi:hypothetical protein
MTSDRLCKPVSDLKSVTVAFREAKWGAYAATPSMQEAFKADIRDALLAQFAREGLQSSTYIGVDLFESAADSSVLARINVTFTGAKVAIEEVVRAGNFSVMVASTGSQFIPQPYTAASTSVQPVPKDRTNTYIAVATAIAVCLISVFLALYIHRRIQKEVYQPIW